MASTRTHCWKRPSGEPRPSAFRRCGSSTGSWGTSLASTREHLMAVKEARRANGSTASSLRFERIHQLRAHEYVAEQIRRHIALRLINPGESLPAERELAVMFGVGRPTIQHALRLLEAAGVVAGR